VTTEAPYRYGLDFLIVLLLSAGGSSAANAADAEKGATAFIRQCALCHTIGKDEPNGFGPNLFGITERKAGTAANYRYSPAFLRLVNWTWSADGIASFIVAPAATIPGNRMEVFQGVADTDVDDLLAFLSTQK
jgi:cytochrome c